MNLERLILEKLNLVHPRMLSKNVLWSDCRLEDPKISLSDIENTLNKLEAKSQVTVVNGEDATRIKITTDGIARLLE